MARSPYSIFGDGTGGSHEGATVLRLLRDGQGTVFGSDNGRVWRYQKGDGQFRLLQLPVPSRVVSIHSLGGDDLLLATAGDGFFICNLAAGTRKHYEASRLPKAPVLSAYRDKTGEVWFEQEVSGTVAHFNPQTGQLKTEVIAVEPTSTDRSRPAFHIHEDVYGTVWVHPYGGGFSRFDKQANCLRPFYNSLSDGCWRFSNKIHSAFPTVRAICGCVLTPRGWKR